MIPSTDLSIGTILVLSGFSLAIYNLKKVIKAKKPKREIYTVLLSQNILLLSVGLTFILKGVNQIETINIDSESELKTLFRTARYNEDIKCNFQMLLVTYAPVVLPFANSFISLVIDNYMSMKTLEDDMKEVRDNAVEVVEHNMIVGSENVDQTNNCIERIKKWLPYVAVIGQWLLPIFLGASMYPMQMKEIVMSGKDFQDATHNCLTMLESKNVTCYETNLTIFQDLKKDTTPITSLEGNIDSKVKDKEISDVISKVYNIIQSFKVNNESKLDNNDEVLNNVLRKSKSAQECMKVCVFNTSYLLVYIFGLVIFCYFVPVTISMIILTKVSFMGPSAEPVKKYIKKDNLYNILLWTPAILEMFVSMLLCQYSSNDMRSSMLMTVANIYQAVKNFLNTRRLRKNVVKPV